MKFVTALMVTLMATAAFGADKEYSESHAGNKAFIEKSVRVPVVIQNLGRNDNDEEVFVEGFENDGEGWNTYDFTETPVAWHKSSFNAVEEDNNLWWCGDTLIKYGGSPAGYDNLWMQWLDTPPLDLSEAGENLSLTFDGWWLLEDARCVPPAGAFDAWDGWLVMISDNGGDDFEPLIPESPAYHAERMSAPERKWGMGETPGWFFCSLEEDWPDTNSRERIDQVDWLDCEFSLADHRGEETVIRWVLFSDSLVASYYEYLSDGGVCIDNILISDGDTDYLVNNADDDPFPEDGELIPGLRIRNEASGDHWEITNEDAHTGEYSAHCPIEENLLNGLMTPYIEIPGGDMYTWFEFWLIANTVAADGDGDGSLDDFFDIAIRTENSGWIRIIYDYGHEQQRPEWYEDWARYGPDSWFAPNDPPEWQVKLNLSQWAGQSVQLVWRVMTDDNMNGNQGTGVWIDDFRIQSSESRENDVGIEWLHIGYPITVGEDNDCQLGVRNFGMATQDNVHKLYRIDRGRQRIPITPWQEIQPGVLEIDDFLLNRLSYSGAAIIEAWTSVNEDNYPENDSAITEFMIYPENMFQLGYDDHRWDGGLIFPVNNGPAVLFAPDMINGNYDLWSLEARWSNQDLGDGINTVMTIFSDDRGSFGAELYSTELTVTSNEADPNVHYIDLSDVDTLKNLEEDFWVFFQIDNEDGLPRILGRNVGNEDSYWGEGHYFNFTGDDVQELAADFQIQAIVTPTDFIEDGKNLLPGNDEITAPVVDFRNLPLNILVTLFGWGTEIVTIDGVEIDNDVFSIDSRSDFPITLSFGESAIFDITFDPEDQGDYTAHVTFDTDDETPPEITIGTTFDVENSDLVTPAEFSLGDAYPNPFNASTLIPLYLPHRAEVNLSVYDLSGRKVVDLVNGIMSAGQYDILFTAERMPAGIYIYRLTADGYSSVKKIALLK